MPAGLDYEELGGFSDPEAAGLLTGVEYSRVGSTAWVRPTSTITTRTAVELA